MLCIHRGSSPLLSDGVRRACINWWGVAKRPIGALAPPSGGMRRSRPPPPRSGGKDGGTMAQGVLVKGYHESFALIRRRFDSAKLQWGAVLLLAKRSLNLPQLRWGPSAKRTHKSPQQLAVGARRELVLPHRPHCEAMGPGRVLKLVAKCALGVHIVRCRGSSPLSLKFSQVPPPPCGGLPKHVCAKRTRPPQSGDAPHAPTACCWGLVWAPEGGLRFAEAASATNPPKGKVVAKRPPCPQLPPALREGLQSQGHHQ
jgi:hypothetical protein